MKNIWNACVNFIPLISNLIFFFLFFCFFFFFSLLYFKQTIKVLLHRRYDFCRLLAACCLLPFAPPYFWIGLWYAWSEYGWFVGCLVVIYAFRCHNMQISFRFPVILVIRTHTFILYLPSFSAITSSWGFLHIFFSIIFRL